jgi:cytoskeletal protein RodZ
MQTEIEEDYDLKEYYSGATSSGATSSGATSSGASNGVPNKEDNSGLSTEQLILYISLILIGILIIVGIVWYVRSEDKPKKSESSSNESKAKSSDSTKLSKLKEKFRFRSNKNSKPDLPIIEKVILNNPPDTSLPITPLMIETPSVSKKKKKKQ